MEKEEKKEYLIKDKRYLVSISRSRRKSLGLRYDPEKDLFICHIPLRCSKKMCDEFIIKYCPKIKEKYEKRNLIKPIDGDDIYIFGEKKRIDGFSSLSEKKQEEFLKKTLLDFIKENVTKNAKIMGIATPYVVKVRKMKTRWGVNNKKAQSLTFSTYLLHYRKEIIESVVIHELAHDRIRNHSLAFYKLVYKYSPNYKELHNALRKGQYE